MSEQSEEERRRRKEIIDTDLAMLALQNAAATRRGRLSIEQVERMIVIDEAWLAATRACMEEGSEPDSPANA